MFKNAQELQPLVHLFKQAQRGISFSQKTSDQIKPLLFDINNKKGLKIIEP